MDGVMRERGMDVRRKKIGVRRERALVLADYDPL